jgi:hypothetical protein
LDTARVYSENSTITKKKESMHKMYSSLAYSSLLCVMLVAQEKDSEYCHERR